MFDCTMSDDFLETTKKKAISSARAAIQLANTTIVLELHTINTN
jgi:hypothetical protein